MAGEGKAYTRDTQYIEDRILDDPDARWPVEPGRYRLVAARACPWANRAIIVRRLLGLEDVISMGLCGPTHDENSWTFDLDPGGLDPVLRIPRLKDAYEARLPGYPRGIIPDGPDLSVWAEPHDRARLGGTPFGDGTAPGAIPEAERVPTSANPLVGTDGLVH